MRLHAGLSGREQAQQHFENGHVDTRTHSFIGPAWGKRVTLAAGGAAFFPTGRGRGRRAGMGEKPGGGDGKPPSYQK